MTPDASQAAMPRGNLPSYVLVTPARNEERFIGRTIESVIAQTTRPLRWVIVSDGSTDRTELIVQQYADEHPWIVLERRPERKERDFAGKVFAFNAGYARVKELSFDCVASLDADITFGAGYFEYLLSKLALDPRLGVVGTPFREGDSGYDYRFVSIEHVSGACQLFRRQCFEEIGGYVPNKGGGIDHIAVLTARMKGWKSRTFTEMVSEHHREMGSATRSPLQIKFNVGRLDYALGGHPVWELFRCAYQMSHPPRVAGGVMIFLGYFSSMLRRSGRSISPELVQFRQREQMTRLRRFFSHRGRNDTVQDAFGREPHQGAS
jgi:poly-beta-1,6-N-acetyl-D-glucosamine synthase